MPPASKKTQVFRHLLAFFALIIYIVSFPWLNSVAGPASTALSMIFVGLVAWSSGMWPGIIAGLLTFPLNVLLLNWIGQNGLESMFPEGVPGTIAIILLAGLVGRVSELEKRVKSELASAKQLKSRLQLVVSKSPIIVFAVDKRGIFTLSEGAGLQKLGLKPGEVVGKSVYEIYKAVPEIVNSIKRALAGDAHPFTTKVGDLYFQTWYSPMTDDKGTVIGVTGVATDVTEDRKKELELQQRTEELEKLNELTIGRELKMEEMKQELSKLQNQKGT